MATVVICLYPSEPAEVAVAAEYPCALVIAYHQLEPVAACNWQLVMGVRAAACFCQVVLADKVVVGQLWLAAAVVLLVAVDQYGLVPPMAVLPVAMYQ
jgi:hypothetical protein